MPTVSTCSMAAAGLPTIDATGFPSRGDVERIVSAYLESLHLPRRAKALIDRDLYRRSAAVLDGTEDKSTQPNFHFWAKKTFRKVPFHPGSAEYGLQAGGHWVACREDFYDTLVAAHISAKHGGRDATFEKVCLVWSRVPKSICQDFVWKCPTCYPETPARKPKKKVTETSIPATLAVEASSGVSPPQVSLEPASSSGSSTPCPWSSTKSAALAAPSAAATMTLTQPLTVGPHFKLYGWSGARIQARLAELDAESGALTSGTISPNDEPPRRICKRLRGHSMPALQTDWFLVGAALSMKRHVSADHGQAGTV